MWLLQLGVRVAELRQAAYTARRRLVPVGCSTCPWKARDEASVAVVNVATTALPLQWSMVAYARNLDGISYDGLISWVM